MIIVLEGAWDADSCSQGRYQRPPDGFLLRRPRSEMVSWSSLEMPRRYVERAVVADVNRIEDEEDATDER